MIVSSFLLLLLNKLKFISIISLVSFWIFSFTSVSSSNCVTSSLFNEDEDDEIDNFTGDDIDIFKITLLSFEFLSIDLSSFNSILNSLNFTSSSSSSEFFLY